MRRIVALPLRRTLALWRAGVIVLAVSGVLSGCAWLDERQRQLALRPTPASPADLQAGAQALRPGDQHYTVQVPSDTGRTHTLALWWLPHPQPGAPALLYLHGTFRNLYRNLPKINALRDAGFAVLAVDYRGWGESEAIVPSESSIQADAVIAWQHLVQRQPDPAQRVVYGHSMGGAVAVRLASGLRHGSDYAALVLESTFTRMPDVAAEAGWVGRTAAGLTTLEFDSLLRMPAIDAPVLMLHGTADKTVPIVLGRRLRDAARPGAVRWVEIEGGSHSRLQQDAPDAYRQALQGLIQTLAPAGRAPATAP